jgi:pimeloyl-ACP methyl ester carboxylesterase
MGQTLYDQIGRQYTSTRRPDPRIAAAICDALGDANSVVNVGAGTGAYEPVGRSLVAVEPSWRMIRQRLSSPSLVVQASAEALPFPAATFDGALPGFSRSTDPPDFAHYSMDQAAGEVAALVRSLELGPATSYGCSSGGQVALRLAAAHSDLVWRAVVHEVPLSVRPELSAMTKLSDDEIVRVSKDLFQNQMNENMEAWLALGEAYHQRLERNYVTWVRRYVGADQLFRAFSSEELPRRPVTWTIGGLTPAAVCFENIVIAHNAGLQVGLLMCKHFPQVTIPDLLADHIGKAARGSDD